MRPTAKTKATFDTRKYGAMLARVAPVVLQNEKEYDRAIEAIDELLNRNRQDWDSLSPRRDEGNEEPNSVSKLFRALRFFVVKGSVPILCASI